MSLLRVSDSEESLMRYFCSDDSWISLYVSFLPMELKDQLPPQGFFDLRSQNDRADGQFAHQDQKCPVARKLIINIPTAKGNVNYARVTVQVAS
jgi:hypothetical protein